MRTVVILPTYNERENIRILIPGIQQVIPKNTKILVVDDRSPDGTGREVRDLQKTHKNLHLLEGNKQGLGEAYLRGFDYATKKLDADIIIMMDADLSHPPKLIPKLIQGINEGNDVVIGSRYIKGGGTPDWNLKRKAISRFGNLFGRYMAGFYKLNDITSGFRAIRVSAFEKINKNNLHTRGYAFLTTLLHELIQTGAKTKEIPLIFYDRKHGKTKLQTKDMAEFFFNAVRLRYRMNERLIKYLAVGGSGILFNLVVFYFVRTLLFSVFERTGAFLIIASVAADELSIIYNFTLNNIWTFRHSRNSDTMIVRLMKFHFVALGSVVINNVVLYTLNQWLGVWDMLAKFIGILVGFVWNYVVNTKWTWRE
jgi:dolichol-phosphate mannosyltransferase